MNAARSRRRPFRGGSGAPRGEGEGRALLDLLRSRDRLVGKGRRPDRTGDAEEEHRRQQQQRQQQRQTDGGGGDDDDDGDDRREVERLERELTSRLRSLAAAVRRRGLFPDAEGARDCRRRAAERTSSASSSSSGRGAAAAGLASGGGGGSSRKRKRNKGGAGGGGGRAGAGPSAAAFGIRLESHRSDDSFAGTSGGDKNADEALVLTALCRILGVTVGRKKGGETEDAPSNPLPSDTSCALIYAALDVLRSLCDCAKEGMASSSAADHARASVEAEMVASVGPPLLDALRDNVLLFYNRSGRDVDALGGLTGCFKACASVTSLLETKLSRAEKTLDGVRNAAWLVLNNLHGMPGGREALSGVRRAAAATLSTLPLSGGAEGAPSAAWSDAVADGTALLRWAVRDFFPMPGADGDGGTEGGGQRPGLRGEHATWVSIAKEAPATDMEVDLGSDPTDEHRSAALLSRIECLTANLRSLLRLECHPPLRGFALLLPLDSLLDAAEPLLSFSLAAEAARRSTKARLRSSPVKDGLVSPNAAVEIAAEVKECGHDLLDATVDACRGGGGTLLWPRARRVLGMAAADLRASCSAAVVAAVDGRQGGGTRPRGSVPLRARSVRSFCSVAVALGAGAMSSAGTARTMCRSLVLLGGCLLEQVTTGGEGASAGAEDDGEGGTPGERAELVDAAACALASSLAVFGGLIPRDVRGALDSITHTSLSAFLLRGSDPVFAHARVARSLLRLGLGCACVPWGDGARAHTTTTQTVRAVAAICRNDPDPSVASAALAALGALDAMSTPRAPPLLVPARGSPADDGGAMTADLLHGMHEARLGTGASKEASGDKSSKRSKNKDETKLETGAMLSVTHGEASKANGGSEAAEGPSPTEGAPPGKEKEDDANGEKSSADGRFGAAEELSPKKKAPAAKESEDANGEKSSGDDGYEASGVQWPAKEALTAKDSKDDAIGEKVDADGGSKMDERLSQAKEASSVKESEDVKDAESTPRADSMKYEEIDCMAEDNTLSYDVTAKVVSAGEPLPPQDARERGTIDKTAKMRSAGRGENSDGMSDEEVAEMRSTGAGGEDDRIDSEDESLDDFPEIIDADPDEEDRV